MIPFPLGHENLKGRRWPVISFILIALNILFFVVTKSQIEKNEEQSPQEAQVKYHILVLSARFPQWVHMTPEVEAYVESVKREQPDGYKMLTASSHEPQDAWEASLLMTPEWIEEKIKAQMDDLCQQYAQFGHTESSTFLSTYAFVPSHPTPQSYITSQFLHVGWLHLIGNMWFLWLAGSILEDAWGRVVYPIFYLAAGVAASVGYLLMSPHSDVPALGASGAIAGLMGAFLARFPKVRIRMAWPIPVGMRIRLIKFSAPAYLMLPLWLANEIFSGFVGHDNVGHWAHIGGFVFGLGGAFLLRASGLEHAMDKKIEDKVSWTAEPEIIRANELLEQSQYDEAIAEAQKLLKTKPGSIDAYEIILKVYEKKGDYAAQKEIIATLCRLYAAAGNGKMAWDCYTLLLNLGGKDLPAATWLEIARYLERDQALERALEEYKNIIEKYPNDRASLNAMLAAARICLKLNHVAEAERMYHAAAVSPVPHLDMEGVINAGLKQCAAAASASAGR